MSLSPRMKLGCLFTLVVSFCIGIGFIAGVVAHQTWKKKTDEPAVIKWMTMKHLEKLNPTAQQRQQLELKVETALANLALVKSDAKRRVWEVIDTAADSIAEDLNPEQQIKWREIRPKQPK